MRSLLLAAIAAFATMVAVPAQVAYFSASLTGDQEVPSVATSATGWGIVRLDQGSGQVNITVHADGVSSVAAHLHLAPASVNGAVIIPLSGGPSDWTGAGMLTASQVNSLLAGGTYLNVHSAAHPGGEIRGQVRNEVTRRFTTTMDGNSATPPTQSLATGQTIAYLHQPSNRLIYELDVTGMIGTVAHIHLGAPGVPGPVIIPLQGSGSRWCGVTAPLSEGQLADLSGGNFYVNVHSMASPAGEIRGQLLEDPGDFAAELDGSQEVPPVATNATGHACLTLNPDRSLSYHVTTRGLIGGTNAHIHAGAPGVNGPVIFPLSGGPTDWQGTIAPLTGSQIATLMSGGYYLNVHTIANPAGEIRAQPLVMALPTTFGSGCVDSVGGRAEIGADGFACLGDPFIVTLQGAQPVIDAFLLFGRSRDQFGLQPLPFELSILAMPTCFLFHDARLVAQARVARTDNLGCAEAQLLIPSDPILIGFDLYGQWFVTDPNSTGPIPLVSSNGLQACLY